MPIERLIRRPAEGLTSAFTAFAEGGGACDDGPLSAFQIDGSTFVLFEVQPSESLDSALNAIATSHVKAATNPKAFNVFLVPLGPDVRIVEQRTLGRGIAAIGLHDAIARAVGLPEGWKAGQRDLARRALSHLFVDDELRTATLYGVRGTSRAPVLSQLEESLLDWSVPPGSLIYLTAEAGKGKSTAFAELVWRHQGLSQTPLPLMIPLRSVPRGAGVSWASITASVGIIGQQSILLGKAAQSGLVSLLLDGLDEVSGRYDPTLVVELLSEIQRAVGGSGARVALSGRTTEGHAVSATVEHSEITLELPETNDPAFLTYVDSVVDAVVPSWPSLAPRVPEPPLDKPLTSDGAPTSQERHQIIEWVVQTFGELGKERSLFFVQSLACLARTKQLAGNKALVIETGETTTLAPATVYEVCVLAAALASIREQDKIEEIARKLFQPTPQLELLTWLAVKASAEDSLRDQLPRANELAKETFSIDPVNQNEEFTAVVRQLQKHALLFAALEPSATAGDWRPQFLSDWVRSACLCRAWRSWSDARPGAKRGLVAQAICRSQRAALAFGVLFPELIAAGRLPDARDLLAILCKEADLDSPEAAANYWNLYAGLQERHIAAPEITPKAIPPMTDLTEIAFAGGELPQAFGGTLAVLVGSEFEGVALIGSRFEACDVASASFRGCRLDRVVFDECDGPLSFESCVLTGCEIRNMRGKAAPLLTMIDCRLLDGTIVVQDKEPATGWSFQPIVAFDGSAADRRADEVLSGDWLGLDPRRVSGLTRIEDQREDPAEICVRAMLKPFFPVRAGRDGQRQARGYIRSSALGRGAMPDGTPTDRELLAILESLGFSSGGRQAHIYAPWSSVGGASTDGVQLRNELLTFLNTGAKSERVATLIDRVRQAGSWP